MPENVAGLPNRGTTFYGPTATIPSTYDGDGIALEGSVHVFEDFAVPSAPGARTKRSNLRQKCVLVRNTGASSLVAGASQVWEATYRGRRTNGNSGTAGAEVAGIVDPFLGSAVVRVGDLYWLVIKGRVRATKVSGTAWTEGDLLLCDNGGKLTVAGVPADATAALANSQAVAGRAYIDAASGDTAAEVQLDCSSWID